MRDRLIGLIMKSDILCHTCGESTDLYCAEALADYLLENGVIVTPCCAMVEQFIKDGKFDNKRTAHNGKYAVVYVDKTMWNCPLIDITEQSYNNEKALKRIQELKMFTYNHIGRTLAEIHKDCGPNINGYCVFVLQDENDRTGIPLDEDISIGAILRKHPEYAKCKVKYENDFYGTTVLRVEKGRHE